MTLRAMVESLRGAATSARHVAVYASARERWPALARCGGPGELLRALGDERPETWTEREAITRAVVAEYRGRGGVLWPSLLLVAFYPALARISGSIVSDLARAEREQIAVLALLDVARALPLSTRFFVLRLCSWTRQRVIAAARREWREQHGELFERDHPLVHPEGRTRDVMRLFRAESPEIRDVLVATVVEGEEIREYAARRVGAERVERETERLKRARSRAFARMREAYGG